MCKQALAPDYTAVNETHRWAFQVFLLTDWVRLGFQMGRSFWNAGEMGNTVIRNETWIIKTHMEKNMVSLGLLTQEQKRKRT